jgi:hypothetical protein
MSHNVPSRRDAYRLLAWDIAHNNNHAPPTNRRSSQTRPNGRCRSPMLEPDTAWAQRLTGKERRRPMLPHPPSPRLPVSPSPRPPVPPSPHLRVTPSPSSPQHSVLSTQHFCVCIMLGNARRVELFSRNCGIFSISICLGPGSTWNPSGRGREVPQGTQKELSHPARLTGPARCLCNVLQKRSLRQWWLTPFRTRFPLRAGGPRPGQLPHPFGGAVPGDDSRSCRQQPASVVPSARCPAGATLATLGVNA